VELEDHRDLTVRRREGTAPPDPLEAVERLFGRRRDGWRSSGAGGTTGGEAGTPTNAEKRSVRIISNLLNTKSQADTGPREYSAARN